MLKLEEDEIKVLTEPKHIKLGWLNWVKNAKMKIARRNQRKYLNDSDFLSSREEQYPSRKESLFFKTNEKPNPEETNSKLFPFLLS